MVSYMYEYKLITPSAKKKRSSIVCFIYIYMVSIQSRNPSRVEPQLSESSGRHTTGSDNRGVRIDEGNQTSPSMDYQVGDN